MAFESLTNEERHLAIRAVWLVATTSVIDDDDLQTVTGFNRQELLEVYGEVAKAASKYDEEAIRAVGQCLNNLTGYPHHQDAFVEQGLGCSMNDLAKLTDKWFGRSKYFDRLQ